MNSKGQASAMYFRYILVQINVCACMLVYLSCMLHVLFVQMFVYVRVFSCIAMQFRPADVWGAAAVVFFLGEYGCIEEPSVPWERCASDTQVVETNCAGPRRHRVLSRH